MGSYFARGSTLLLLGMDSFHQLIMITGFVVVNLIIAIICNAVHVMGGESYLIGNMSPTNGSNHQGIGFDVDQPSGVINGDSGAIDHAQRSSLDCINYNACNLT